MPSLELQPTIRKTSETAEWEYKDEAKFLYGVGQKMMERFFNGLVYLDGRQVPAPLIAFDDLRNHRVLACYDLFPDEYGLMYKITFNTEQYSDGAWRYGRYAQCETELHEMIHTWQQHGRGNHPYKGGRETHNLEFVTKCKELGLNSTRGIGVHFAPPDPDSPFDILMKELFIRPPEGSDEIEAGRINWFIVIDKRKTGGHTGKSSLSKWTCPECGINARMGIKGDPRIIHAPCSEKRGEPVFFVQAVAMLGMKQEDM